MPLFHDPLTRPARSAWRSPHADCRFRAPAVPSASVLPNRCLCTAPSFRGHLQHAEFPGTRDFPVPLDAPERRIRSESRGDRLDPKLREKFRENLCKCFRKFGENPSKKLKRIFWYFELWNFEFSEL